MGAGMGSKMYKGMGGVTVFVEIPSGKNFHSIVNFRPKFRIAVKNLPDGILTKTLHSFVAGKNSSFFLKKVYRNRLRTFSVDTLGLLVWLANFCICSFMGCL